MVSLGNKAEHTPQDLVNIGLNELGLNQVEVLIRSVPVKLMKESEKQGHALDGFIIGSGDRYVLYVNKTLSPVRLRRTIAHELIHLQQIRSKKLIIVDKYSVVWKGKLFKNIDRIEYNSRGWEKEAISLSHELSLVIKSQTK